MPSHSYYVQWTNGARTTAKTVTETAAAEVNVEETIAPSSTDVQVNIALDVSAMKSAYLLATADMTLETNSGSAPDATINLTANVPKAWYTGANGTNPFGAVDVTKVYVTSTDGGTLTMNCLQDPTP